MVAVPQEFVPQFVPAVDPRDWLTWSPPDRTPSFEASEPESSCFPKTYIYVRFAVVVSNHWCTARGTHMTHNDAQDKKKTMRNETINMDGAVMEA